MRRVAAYLYGFVVYGPIYTRHYLLNGIDKCFRKTDRIFYTSLGERLKNARVAAVEESKICQKPFTLRAVWDKFMSPHR